MLTHASIMRLTQQPTRYLTYRRYASIFSFDDSYKFYGAFYRGQQVGYGAAKNGQIVHVSALREETTRDILAYMVKDGNDEADATLIDPELLRGVGFVNTAHKHFAAPKGKAPKDMISESVPFIYDAIKHLIQVGFAGERPRDVLPYRSEFSKGGVVEGEYQPGGKMLIYPSNTGLYTTNQIMQTWLRQFPHLEITGLELDLGDKKKEKIAGNWCEDKKLPGRLASNQQMDPGAYLRFLVSADPASSNAYRALEQAGGKVYVVGGAVRDVLRGGDPRDLDLMVTGLPSDAVNNILEQLPGRVDLTGKNFGVYRYRHDGSEVEIALPRQDKYDTARRGEGQITVDHNLPVESDLQRRDFTVNSLAADLDNGEIIDPFGGQDDIEKNILRTTHPNSFREDPTRLVRALTAHSRFGLNPDERTRHEMEENAHMLRNESPDALNKHLDKLFASHNPAAAIRLAHETGVLGHLFPEVHDQWDFDQRSKYHKYPLGEHLVNVLDNVSSLSSDPDLRMAGLLHDIGKPASAWEDSEGYRHFYRNDQGQGAQHEEVGAQMAEQRLRALNYPVARINRVKHLISNHMFPRFDTQKGARRFLQRVGDEHADDLLTLGLADGMGHGWGPEYWNTRTPIDRMRSYVDEVRKNQQPTDLQNLAINGNDLLNLGMRPGPAVGQVLRNLLNDVVENPQDNNPARLTELAQGYIRALQ